MGHMFKDPAMGMSQDLPLEEKLLPEFEKKPVTCDIRPDKELVTPAPASPSNLRTPIAPRRIYSSGA